MQAPDPKLNPIEVPDDVKAELNKPLAAAAAPPVKAAVPVPEDVLAEQDAEVRAAEVVPGDDGTQPALEDEDSER